MPLTKDQIKSYFTNWRQKTETNKSIERSLLADQNTAIELQTQPETRDLTYKKAKTQNCVLEDKVKIEKQKT